LSWPSQRVDVTVCLQGDGPGVARTRHIIDVSGIMESLDEEAAGPDRLDSIMQTASYQPVLRTRE